MTVGEAERRLIFETLAFVLGYRYFLHLRAKKPDPINDNRRTWIFIGAALGALAGAGLLCVIVSAPDAGTATVVTAKPPLGRHPMLRARPIACASRWNFPPEKSVNRCAFGSSPSGFENVSRMS